MVYLQYCSRQQGSAPGSASMVRSGAGGWGGGRGRGQGGGWSANNVTSCGLRNSKQHWKKATAGSRRLCRQVTGSQVWQDLVCHVLVQSSTADRLDQYHPPLHTLLVAPPPTPHPHPHPIGCSIPPHPIGCPTPPPRCYILVRTRTTS